MAAVSVKRSIPSILEYFIGGGGGGASVRQGVFIRERRLK